MLAHPPAPQISIQPHKCPACNGIVVSMKLRDLEVPPAQDVVCSR
jgi:hypothetical protein